MRRLLVSIEDDGSVNKLVPDFTLYQNGYGNVQICCRVKTDVFGGVMTVSNTVEDDEGNRNSSELVPMDFTFARDGYRHFETNMPYDFTKAAGTLKLDFKYIVLNESDGTEKLIASGEIIQEVIPTGNKLSGPTISEQTTLQLQRSIDKLTEHKLDRFDVNKIVTYPITYLTDGEKAPNAIYYNYTNTVVNSNYNEEWELVEEATVKTGSLFVFRNANLQTEVFYAGGLIYSRMLNLTDLEEIPQFKRNDETVTRILKDINNFKNKVDEVIEIADEAKETAQISNKIANEAMDIAYAADMWNDETPQRTPNFTRDNEVIMIDGRNDMAADYAPENPKSVSTKEYVDSVKAALEAEIDNLKLLGQNIGSFNTLTDLPDNISYFTSLIPPISPTPNDYVWVDEDANHDNRTAIYKIKNIDKNTGDITWEFVRSFASEIVQRDFTTQPIQNNELGDGVVTNEKLDSTIIRVSAPITQSEYDELPVKEHMLYLILEED